MTYSSAHSASPLTYAVSKLMHGINWPSEIKTTISWYEVPLKLADKMKSWKGILSFVGQRPAESWGLGKGHLFKLNEFSHSAYHCLVLIRTPEKADNPGFLISNMTFRGWLLVMAPNTVPKPKNSEDVPLSLWEFRSHKGICLCALFQDKYRVSVVGAHEWNDVCALSKYLHMPRYHIMKHMDKVFDWTTSVWYLHQHSVSLIVTIITVVTLSRDCSLL